MTVLEPHKPVDWADSTSTPQFLLKHFPGGAPPNTPTDHYTDDCGGHKGENGDTSPGTHGDFVAVYVPEDEGKRVPHALAFISNLKLT
ncbi:UNVERIFIED_CONTAM: hypothetical protein Sradi_6996600 [Sesamum radiatum]|uniref:Uncharacterized protein n=1 Tax=Sesamum radiatum TaxID=300843 RepID=A0AAW2JDH8_SESRA